MQGSKPTLLRVLLLVTLEITAAYGRWEPLGSGQLCCRGRSTIEHQGGRASLSGEPCSRGAGANWLADTYFRRLRRAGDKVAQITGRFSIWDIL
jgi:hypothetical protein